MSISFLTPLFLAAASLIAIPWIIHLIRRPEHEKLRFSSLMFIPKITREVIERRRLQHILLMLLRMLTIILLVLAFSRPFWKSPPKPANASSSARHMILLDKSFSMAAKNHFEDAKKRAQSIVDSLQPSERVGVITFASVPRLSAPLESKDEPESGSVSRARDAIAAAQSSEESTAYIPAMQMAQEQLLAGEVGSEDEEPDTQLVLHLISDFQKPGLPAKNTGWRLSPRIKLDATDVGEDDLVNQAVSDLSLRKTAEGSLRLQAKIKNWSAQEQQTEVKLIIGGETKQTASISVRGGNASQASFTIAVRSQQRLEGWVEIGPDDLALDNRRYFVWSPAHKKQAILIADPHGAGESWPASWFLESAIPQGERGPWEVTKLAQRDLVSSVEEGKIKPVLLIVGDMFGIETETAKAIRQFADSGGQVLLMLNGSISSEALNANLLQGTGISSEGIKYPESRSSRFDLLSWIDFDHPIFSPMQGSRFNDFSQVRFFNHHQLAVKELEASNAQKDLPGPKVLARFEADEANVERPAIIEASLGQGRIIVWAFGADLQWSNFPKHIKFIPVLLETLNYLTGDERSEGNWAVGDAPPKRILSSIKGDRLKIQYPGENEKELDSKGVGSAEVSLFKHSGFFRWGAAGQQEWDSAGVVNVNPAESDLSRITLPDFELKATSKSSVEDRLASSLQDQDKRLASLGVKREFWQALLIGLLISLLVECWYASRLLR